MKTLSSVSSGGHDGDARSPESLTTLTTTKPRSLMSCGGIKPSWYAYLIIVLPSEGLLVI
jgi:hypothetical protein